MATTDATKLKNPCDETCGCCELRKVHILMEPTRYRKDDVPQSCDGCGEWLCERCASVDETGTVSCTNCIADQGFSAAVLGEDIAAQPAPVAPATAAAHPFTLCDDQSCPCWNPTNRRMP